MQLNEIMKKIEQWANPALKEDWDNVGLQLGDPKAEIQRVLLALTPSLAVAEEAVRLGADLILTHHPFIFKGVKTLRADTPIGRMSQLCVKHDIAIYCAHTNLDIVRGGVNDVLAERLGLVDVRDFVETVRTPRLKVVVFVPLEHLETVQTAMCAAGGGSLGNYSDCTWSVAGQGQFRPLAGSDPFLGRQGALSKTEEVRLEMIVSAEHLSAVIQAMKAAHPYEMPAYDVFTNLASEERQSLGRMGQLPKPVPLKDWLDNIKRALDIPVVAYAGDEERVISRVALCGGSAAEYMDQAKAMGADAYITGDMRYHDAQHARELGLAVVDVTHYGGERPVLWRLQDYLNETFGDALDVLISKDETNFIQYQ